MKGIILAEMAFLFWAGIAMRKWGNNLSWRDVLVDEVFKRGLAVVILLAILLVMADAGWGGLAATFGGLVVTGAMVYWGVPLAKMLETQSKGLNQ